MDVRKNFFNERVMKYWHRLLSEVIKVSLEVFKRRLDVALQDMV